MTSDELLDRMRYYTDDKAIVAVLEHGTCVSGILVPGSTKTVEWFVQRMMKQFDVPRDGEGSPAGDFAFQNMDDGNVVIAFMDPWHYCCTVRSREEISKKVIAPVSETEVLLDTAQNVRGVNDVSHGLAARANRTRDARELNIVRSYDPRQVKA